MLTTKAHNYECCMCGDQGLSKELFRCKVCHFRSQHRYCSDLYPKAESYRVCNWCLIQKDDNLTTTSTTTTTTTPTPTSTRSNNNSNSSSLQDNNSKTTKLNKFHNHLGVPKAGAGPRGLRPTSPIKKPMKSPEARSPSGRKRITAINSAAQEDRLRRTKSEEMSNNSSSSSRSSGGPAVIKHVFRNKVRRYKLLDEVSS